MCVLSGTSLFWPSAETKNKYGFGGKWFRKRSRHSEINGWLLDVSEWSGSFLEIISTRRCYYDFKYQRIRVLFKFVTTSQPGQEVVYLRELLRGSGYTQRKTTKIWEDNVWCIIMLISENLTDHDSRDDRSRHFDVKVHYHESPWPGSRRSV